MLAFNNFVAIDWSGAESPKQTPAIVVATCGQGQTAPQNLATKLSRQDVFNHLGALLKTTDKITLVGIDANLGYAQHMARQLCGFSATAAQLWQMVDDTCQHSPNFFGAPMWQHPNFAPFYWVQGKKPDDWLPQHHRRLTETACGQQGLGYPENPFKLLGAKQVGRGGLAAMRLLHQLKQQWGDVLCVWPFEQPTAKTRMVLLEIYPRLFLQHAQFGTKKLRHATDLNHVLATFNTQAYNSAQTLTDHLTDALAAAAGLRYFTTHHTIWQALPPLAQKEGWIFGVHSPYS